MIQTSAQYRLGMLYDHGSPETPKDEVKAAEWFRRSAEQGDAKGEYALGIAYLNGLGVPKDEAVGFDWVYKSALKGNLAAQKNLWSLYGARGRGTLKNESEGLDWLLASARNGYPLAQTGLCVLTRTYAAWHGSHDGIRMKSHCRK